MKEKREENRKEKTGRKSWLLPLLCMLLLTGCSGKDGSATGSGDPGAAPGNSYGTENGGAPGENGSAGNGSAADDNTTTGGAVSGSGNTVSLWISATEAIPFEGPETGYQEGISAYAAMGNSVYLMRTEEPENGGAAQLCVQIYDSDTKETAKHILSLDIPECRDGYVVSLDLTAKRELSLKLMRRESKNESFLVKMDLQGTVLEVEKPFPAADEYPWNQDLLSTTSVFPLADGSVILNRWDAGSQASVLTRLNEETGQKESLGTLADGEALRAVCCDEEGILYYYSSMGCIIRWNPEKDLREELTAPLYQEDINVHGTAGLIRNAQGDLLLCDLGRDSASLYVLTKEKPVAEEEIRLAFVQDPVGNEYLRAKTAVFAREGGALPIVMEGLEESDYTDYRNRIFAEILAGKGPELLFLSYEDMETLQEKGLLCDLSEMISADTLSQMLPGALELGRVNGQLAGITPEIAFSTMITSDAVWEADSWTISQFTELLKEKENCDWPVSFYDAKVSYYTLFWMIFCNDLSHSPFLDLEEGKCYFDSQEFTDILKLCKEYGRPSSETRSWEERARMLREGECLAAISSLYIGFRDFSDMMLGYGQDCHIVGFPGAEAGCSFIQNYSQGYLAVNIHAEHKEEIADYINYLLSYEKQYEVMGTSVRLDVIRDSIGYDEFRKQVVQRTSAEPDGPLMEIAMKPDGTSFEEEYLDFIQSCKPNPNRIPLLAEIIGEELFGCFEGGKSVEDAADDIQNRVQLYLDESRP